MTEPRSLLDATRYRTAGWREAIVRICKELGLDPDRASSETDPSPEMEGIYVKWEEDGRVFGRYKYVRASFLTAVEDSGSHWRQRPIVPNRLQEGVDSYD